jgi:predicted small lipoprotein YifL
MKLLILYVLVSICGCSLKQPVQLKPALANVDMNAQQDVNAIKAQFDNKMEKLEKLFESLKVSGQVSGAGQIGANRNETIQAETVTQSKSSVNDSGLMEAIFKYWYGIFVLIIGFMKWNSVSQSRQYEKHIKQLQIEKDDYKNRYLAVGISNEEQLKAFRKEHEALKKEA